MSGIKFVTESSKKFNFESVRRDLVLLFINFMDENAYLHVYVFSKRHTYNFDRIFLVLGNSHSHKVRIARN